MAYVLIQNGLVAQKQPYPSEGFVQAPDDVICGWAYANGVFSPPVTPEPGLNLSPLEPWRFWAMMKLSGNENVVKAYVANLDDPQKSIATAMLDYSQEYRRDHPLVDTIRQVLTMDNEQLNTLWDQGHQLEI